MLNYLFIEPAAFFTACVCCAPNKTAHWQTNKQTNRGNKTKTSIGGLSQRRKSRKIIFRARVTVDVGVGVGVDVGRRLSNLTEPKYPFILRTSHRAPFAPMPIRVFSLFRPVFRP